MDQVMEKKEGNNNPRFYMDADSEEDAIKLLTDGHSDLTFLGWPA